MTIKVEFNFADNFSVFIDMDYVPRENENVIFYVGGEHSTKSVVLKVLKVDWQIDINMGGESPCSAKAYSEILDSNPPWDEIKKYLESIE